MRDESDGTDSGDRDRQLRDELERGEALRFEAPLRSGRLGLSDDRILLVTDEPVSVPFENVSEVTIQSIDWYLMVLSAVLLGIAALVAANNPWLAGAFAAFAVGNVYWTYRKRNRLRLHTHSRPHPITVYVDDPDELRQALEPALEQYRADHERPENERPENE